MTAKGSHSGLRVQFYDAPGRRHSVSTPWTSTSRLWKTGVSTTLVMPDGTRRVPPVFKIEPAGKLETAAYEGERLRGHSDLEPGGGIYQAVSLPITAGESLCADAEVVTAGASAGAEGRMALTFFGPSGNESSSVYFGPLQAEGKWTPVSTCVTASGPETGFRVRFYDDRTRPVSASTP